MALENVLLDDFKYRWSTLCTFELDFRLSHSLHRYNLVVFTYLQGARFVNKSSLKHRCIKRAKAAVEESQMVVDY